MSGVVWGVNVLLARTRLGSMEQVHSPSAGVITNREINKGSEDGMARQMHSHGAKMSEYLDPYCA